MIIKKMNENIESDLILDVIDDTVVTHLFRKFKCIVTVVCYVFPYPNIPHCMRFFFSEINDVDAQYNIEAVTDN